MTRWNPFRELDEIQNRLGSLFGGRSLRSRGEGIEATDWTPLVDVTEDEKEYLITAELPDLKKEEVKVTVENGTLHISGERKFEEEKKGRKYHRIERAYGAFERCFTVPEGTKVDKLTAEYKDGVLHIHLPKAEEVKPHPVEVKIN